MLYLACLEDTHQQIGLFKTVLGQSFARLWDKSRQLRTSIHAIAEEERSLFRVNPIWELGAQPVDTAAIRELGIIAPRVREAARYVF